MTIQIRRAEATDAEGVYEVHIRAIREICGGHYSRADIDAWAGQVAGSGSRICCIRGLELRA